MHVDDKAAKDRLLEAMESRTVAQTFEASNLPPDEPRRWLVEGWLPAARLSLLAGPGGVGKSWLGVALAAVAGAGGGAFLGDDGHDPDAPRPVVTGGPAVYVSWEDELGEIGRRVRTIGNVLGRGLGSGLHLAPHMGLGPLWGPPDGKTANQAVAGLTAAGGQLRRSCEAKSARLLVLDPLAATFAGNENDRAAVRAFCADWDAWAQATDCAVLLIAHPPKATAADYSGSSDWQGSVRSMHTLGLAKHTTPGKRGRRAKGATPDEGKAKEVNAPALQCVKASYGLLPNPVWLHRVEGNGGAWYSSSVPMPVFADPQPLAEAEAPQPEEAANPEQQEALGLV